VYVCPVVLRNAVSHLTGHRVESYLPVFASSLPTSSSSASAKPVQSVPFTTSTPASPNATAATFNYSRGQTTPKGTASIDNKGRLLESQQLSLQIIRLYSIGYHDATAISVDRENQLLNAPSISPAQLAAQQQQQMGSSSLNRPPPPVQGISLLAQEEQLGQHIEKRLRQVFRLPDAPSTDPRIGGVTPRAVVDANGSDIGFAGVPPPRSLLELEPDRTSGDPFLRLTAAGRAQVRSGARLCSRFDVPVLGGEEAIPPASDQIPFILHWARVISKQLNKKWNLPTKPGGFQFDLRVIANQTVFTTMTLITGFLLLLILFRLFR
jgi:hypothetical protein